MVSEKKLARRAKQQQQQTGLILGQIEPLTDNQARCFDYFYNGHHMLLHGVAGTGKSFISLYLALDQVLRRGKYSRVVIVRSVVPTRDMGFLPGTAVEKAAAYESPYRIMCARLFGGGDAYEILKKMGIIEFDTTSFMRGITIDNAIIIVDEINNMDFQELDTVMTRIGDNCRLFFCGDYRQSDFRRDNEREGLHRFVEILDSIADFKHVEFDTDDIVRSGIVRSYIIAKLSQGIV